MAVDLLSKWLIWRTLADAPDQKLDIIKGVLCFRLARNAGIAFGIPLGRWLILMVNLSGILLILYLFLTSDKRVRAGHIGMGLILAGALGNLVDRILPPHTVRDFIDFPFWPTFNPADVFLCVGVGLLALSILWGHKETSSTRLR